MFLCSGRIQIPIKIASSTQRHQPETVTSKFQKIPRFESFATGSLGNPLAKRLLKENNEDYVNARNDGLLVHGFNAHASQLTQEHIHSVIEKLEQLLYADKHEAREWLMVARSLDFRNLTET